MLKLVIIGQQDGGRAPVSLRDDPERSALRVLVDRQEAIILLQRQLVFSPVFGANVAPVALGVSGECSRYVRGRYRSVNGSRHVEGSKREPSWLIHDVDVSHDNCCWLIKVRPLCVASVDARTLDAPPDVKALCLDRVV